MFRIDSKIDEDHEDDFVLDVGPQSRRRKYKDSKTSSGFTRGPSTFEARLEEDRSGAAWNRANPNESGEFDDVETGDIEQYQDDEYDNVQSQPQYSPSGDRDENASVISDSKRSEAPAALSRYLDADQRSNSNGPSTPFLRQSVTGARPGSSSNSIARDYQDDVKANRRRSSQPSNQPLRTSGKYQGLEGRDIDEMSMDESVTSSQVPADVHAAMQHSLANMNKLRSSERTRM